MIFEVIINSQRIVLYTVNALLQLYPVGDTLKGLYLANNVVICHHSLRMDQHYYNVICVFSNKRK